MEEEKRRMDQIEADRRLAVSRGGREGGREGRGREERGRRLCYNFSHRRCC